MPVLHRREDDSGFYLRGRIHGSWVTWQVTLEGEQWLLTSGFVDGETIDLDLLEMFIDKDWVYTAGTGPGIAGGESRPSFIKIGEGVKHLVFGIGEIKEVLNDGTCRVLFFREYPDTRIVPMGELTTVRSLELARERSAAYERAQRLKMSPKPKTIGSAPGGSAEQEGRSGTSPASPVSAHVSRSSGCLSLLAGFAFLGLLVELISIF